jgi:adenylate cyclase
MKNLLRPSIVIICLSIYLFVSAPEKLPSETRLTSSEHIDVKTLFDTANGMNSVARRIFTSEIVGAGKKVGLEFGEDWKEEHVDKGPLPALFLRELSAELEKRPEPLGLYLGSDEPINPSNLFKDQTAEDYKKVLSTRSSVYSNLEGYGSIAMFPDFASAAGCVTCHNEHPDAPKRDWELHDIMGATTWTWPSDATTSEEVIEILNVEISALGSAYQKYLDKSAKFAKPPAIGDDWPSSGKYVLPSKQIFLNKVLEEAALVTLSAILKADQNE